MARNCATSKSVSQRELVTDAELPFAYASGWHGARLRNFKAGGMGEGEHAAHEGGGTQAARGHGKGKPATPEALSTPNRSGHCGCIALLSAPLLPHDLDCWYPLFKSLSDVPSGDYHV